jgi:hypothetical protein
LDALHLYTALLLRRMQREVLDWPSGPKKLTWGDNIFILCPER